MTHFLNNNNQSLRDSIKDVIDEKSQAESYDVDLSKKEKSILSYLRLEELVVGEVVELPVRAAAGVRVGSSGGKGGGGEWG